MVEKRGRLIVVVGHDNKVVDVQISNLFHYLVRDYWTREFLTSGRLSEEDRLEIAGWVNCGRMAIASHQFVDEMASQKNDGLEWDEILPRFQLEPVPDIIVYIKSSDYDENTPIYQEMAEKNILAPWVIVSDGQGVMEITCDIIKGINEKLQL